MSKDAPEPAADEIVQRMRAIRSQLPADVERVRDRVSDLTSLRYYMRQHPLPLLGIAATAGFALAPSLASRSRKAGLGSSSGSKSRGQVQEEKVVESSAKGGVIGGLLATAASMLLRKAMTSAVDSAMTAFSTRAQQQAQFRASYADGSRPITPTSFPNPAEELVNP